VINSLIAAIALRELKLSANEAWTVSFVSRNLIRQKPFREVAIPFGEFDHRGIFSAGGDTLESTGFGFFMDQFGLGKPH
jgi:hypothetical protein